jgi:hypothetical protein
MSPSCQSRLLNREQNLALRADRRQQSAWLMQLSRHTSARVVEDGMEEVHGVRAPGTGLPGVIRVGTWRGSNGVTFAVCHGRSSLTLPTTHIVGSCSPSTTPTTSSPA